MFSNVDKVIQTAWDRSENIILICFLFLSFKKILYKEKAQ